MLLTGSVAALIFGAPQSIPPVAANSKTIGWLVAPIVCCYPVVEG
jgi:hypothetical protein